MKQVVQRKTAVTTAEPALLGGPRPFALRFAEVSSLVHDGVRPTEFCDELTVYLTGKSSDMVELTD